MINLPGIERTVKRFSSTLNIIRKVFEGFTIKGRPIVTEVQDTLSGSLQPTGDSIDHRPHGDFEESYFDLYTTLDHRLIKGDVIVDSEFGDLEVTDQEPWRVGNLYVARLESLNAGSNDNNVDPNANSQKVNKKPEKVNKNGKILTVWSQEQYEDLFHELIQRLTEIDPTLIRPMMQANDARVGKNDMGEFRALTVNDTWCSFFVHFDEDDEEEPKTSDDGQSVEFRRTMRLEVNMWGPEAQLNAVNLKKLLSSQLANDIIGPEGIAMVGRPTSTTTEDPVINDEYWRRRLFSATFNQQQTVTVPDPQPEEIESAPINTRVIN